MIPESLEVVWLWNPAVTCDNISLMIYVSLGAIWVVEFNYHPRQQFVDDF